MRVLALALLFALPAAQAGQRVLHDKDSGSWVRLHDAPCVSAAVLGMVPVGVRPMMQRMAGELNGRALVGCWLDGEDGTFLVLLDDGQAARFDAAGFRDEPWI
jgi:hypothetical protein